MDKFTLLQKYNDLFKNGIISETEYNNIKDDILENKKSQNIEVKKIELISPEKPHKLSELDKKLKATFICFTILIISFFIYGYYSNSINSNNTISEAIQEWKRNAIESNLYLDSTNCNYNYWKENSDKPYYGISGIDTLQSDLNQDGITDAIVRVYIDRCDDRARGVIPIYGEIFVVISDGGKFKLDTTFFKNELGEFYSYFSIADVDGSKIFGTNLYVESNMDYDLKVKSGHSIDYITKENSDWLNFENPIYEVFTNKSYIFEKPSANSKSNGYLVANDKVCTLDYESKFVKIKYTNKTGNSTIGWIYRKDIIH